MPIRFRPGGFWVVTAAAGVVAAADVAVVAALIAAGEAVDPVKPINI